MASRLFASVISFSSVAYVTHLNSKRIKNLLGCLNLKPTTSPYTKIKIRNIYRRKQFFARSKQSRYKIRWDVILIPYTKHVLHRTVDMVVQLYFSFNMVRKLFSKVSVNTRYLYNTLFFSRSRLKQKRCFTCCSVLTVNHSYRHKQAYEQLPEPNFSGEVSYFLSLLS